MRLDAVVRTDEPDDARARRARRARAARATASTARDRRPPGLTPEAALAALPADVADPARRHAGARRSSRWPTALEAVVEKLAGHALVMVDPNMPPGRSSPTPTPTARRLRRVLARSDVREGLRGGPRLARPGAPRGWTPRATLLARRPARRAAHARRRAARVVTGAAPRWRCPRRASRSSTRSAPATRSAAASSPGGARRARPRGARRPSTRSSRPPTLRLPRRRAHVRARRRLAAVPARGHAGGADRGRVAHRAPPVRCSQPWPATSTGPSAPTTSSARSGAAAWASSTARPTSPRPPRRAEGDRARARRRPAFRERFEREARAGGLARAPERRPGLRGRRGGRRAVHRDALRRRARPAPPRCASDGRARARRAGARSSPRWRARSTRRTAPGSCTATSSPPTSCSPTGDDEHVYLTDFGLTREAASESGLTLTGQWVGTLDYVAPEQIRGEPIDARADVYALGCLVFQALTGRAAVPGRAARRGSART